MNSATDVALARNQSALNTDTRCALKCVPEGISRSYISFLVYRRLFHFNHFALCRAQLFLWPRHLSQKHSSWFKDVGLEHLTLALDLPSRSQSPALWKYSHPPAQAAPSASEAEQPELCELP